MTMDTPDSRKDDGDGDGGFTLVTRRKLVPSFQPEEERSSDNFFHGRGRNAAQVKTRIHSRNHPSSCSSNQIPIPAARPGIDKPAARRSSSSDAKPFNAFNNEPANPSTTASDPCMAEDVRATLKAKKKKDSKAARQRRKEEAKFKSIYGPKDSRIQVMSPAMFAKFQGQAQGGFSHPTPKVNQFKDIPMPPVTEASLVSFPKPQWGKSLNFSPTDLAYFPVLGAKVTLTRNETLQSNKSGSTSGTVNEAEAEIPSTSNSVSASIRRAKLNSESEIVSTKAVRKESDSPISETEKPGVSTPTNLEPPKINKKKPSKAPLVVSIDALLFSKKNAATKQTQAKVKAERKLIRLNDKSLQPAGNILDSSGIKVMHRGKMRETPKKKKPSRLKRAILLSRQLRKQLVISENQSQSLAEKALMGLGTGTRDLSSEFATALSLDNSHESQQSTLSNPTCDVNLVKVEPKSPDGKQELLDESTPDLESECPYEAEASEEPICTPMKETTGTPDYFHKLVEGSLKTEPLDDAQTEPEASAPTPEIIEAVKSQMHNRKFRKYCDMYTSKELHGFAISLMKQLHAFQDKLYKTDLLKYKLKRRYVHGIKEIMNYMSINKVQLIILAPDIESNKNVKGGLDDVLDALLTTAKSKNVPVIYSGNRYILGKTIYIKTPVSAIGILDHQGAEEQYRKVLEESEQLRLKYQTEFDKKVKELMMCTTAITLEESNATTSKE